MKVGEVEIKPALSGFVFRIIFLIGTNVFQYFTHLYLNNAKHCLGLSVWHILKCDALSYILFEKD